MDVLCRLLENGGYIAPSEGIVAAVWNEKAVESNAASRAINQIRVALDGDPSGTPHRDDQQPQRGVES